MVSAADDNRKTPLRDQESSLRRRLALATILRSIALSLMDTADRIAEWLERPSDNKEE
ncbi:MAG: hypothetical protein ACE10G_10125 [Gemmatimonadales bacterium]